ncbi:MAG: aldo/keto reductase [Pirellulales bacterium]|nr:aldo/keto reductase [Pirellulales bacterium]
MKIKRREFLGAAAVAGATVAGSGVSAVAAGAKDADALNPVAMVPFGKNLKVTRIGFGTGMRAWRRTSNQIKLGKEHFENLFRYCYDKGIRLFDTADLYGSHGYAARSLKGKPRDSYSLVSKIWWRKDGVPDEDKGDADVVVKRFLKELQTDYIDVVHLHCMTDPKWPENHRKQMDLLEDLKQKGLIRAHGVSCHSLGAMEAAAKEPWVDAVNIRVNPFHTKTDGKAEKILPVIKNIHAAGKGVIGMKIIGEGQFTGDSQKIDDSVKFAVDSGAVDCMIVGFEQTAQIDDFIGRVKKALAKKAKKKTV